MSQTVNLGIKYSKNIQQQFTRESILKGRLENDVDFVGAKTVRIHTINTVPMNDYDRTKTANRYGVPEEVGDTVQELMMKQDKSFTGTVDKGNNIDQAINKAGKFLRVQLDEQVIPMMDKYGFGVLAHQAGKIVVGTAIDKTNVVAKLNAARAYLMNSKVPVKGRTWYIRSEIFDALTECDSFISLESLGGKAVAKGQVGTLFGAPVVEVPADLMPSGAMFMLVHKSAASSPSKISDTKVHIDPPGVSGSLIEGRFYWDTFVFGAKADGIYVYIDNTYGDGAKASKLANVTIHATTGVITAAGTGATAKYTLDGTDPRFSFTAQEGTAPVLATGETVVKAYSLHKTDEKVYRSDVVTVTVTKA